MKYSRYIIPSPNTHAMANYLTPLMNSHITDSDSRVRSKLYSLSLVGDNASKSMHMQL